MSPLPPPTPALWCPRLRGWLQRGLTRMDRRKARQLATYGQTVVDVAWRRDYEQWWMEHGWMIGARTPEQAWEDLTRARQGRPS